jgi:elongation factor Ts
MEILKKQLIIKGKRLAAAQKNHQELQLKVLLKHIHMVEKWCIVEVNCETDFVAKTDKFKALVKDMLCNCCFKPKLHQTEEVMSQN